VLCALASTVAVTQAIGRSAIAPGLYRFARIPAAVAALTMLVVTAALVLWGLDLRTEVPSLFDGNDGLLSTSTAANWLIIASIMAVATIIAIVAAITSFSAASDAPTGSPATQA
jgi:hypothetical protein